MINFYPSFAEYCAKLGFFCGSSETPAFGECGSDKSNTLQVISNNLLNISNKNTIISHKWSKKLEKVECCSPHEKAQRPESTLPSAALICI
jgi:hypothetical protein